MSFVMTLALAAAASVQAGEAPRSTPQQAFDEASKAAAEEDCKQAVTLFEALERRSVIKPGSLPAAAMAARKGTCLVRLGRAEEGEAAILAGLPGLERAGAEFNADLAKGLATLGSVALDYRWDYASARSRYEKAVSLSDKGARLYYMVGLLKASVFDSDPQALTYADEAIGLASEGDKPSKETQATFHALKARLLLNRGENEAGYAEARKALDLSGGLGLSKVSLSDASIRGDVALGALLMGRKEDARRYLAYTGQGRIAASPFATAVSMLPPDCGDATGLRPDDLAVVEFGIGDDGAVAGARTIYSRGGPEVAAAFARAVSEWYWQPQTLEKIPPFYRLATRVELRCSTAGGPAPGVIKPLIDRFSQWAAGKLALPMGESAGKAQQIAALRSELARREQSGDIAGQVAAIGMLTIADPRASVESVKQIDRAIAMAGDAGVPVEVVNALRIFRLACVPSMRGRQWRSVRVEGGEDVAQLLQKPEIIADALASDTLRLADGKNTVALQQVADDDRLPAQHPLRQVALLKLANGAAGVGDLAAAQSYFARTGLTEQQCALIGARPGVRKTGADGSDFPMEAMRYGFEGWVNLEFDIAADGRTANARPVIAYPPFVFVDAAKGVTRDIRYETSYRPSGNSVACSANRETIKFIIP